MTASIRPRRLAGLDPLRLGTSGLRVRPLRVLLAALGIAIGVAAMIAVIGISVSSRAHLNTQLDKLGTNLLRVTPGTTPDGGPAQLPPTATRMVKAIGPVQDAAAIGAIKGGIYRNQYIPTGRTNSIAVLAAQPGLLHSLRATMHIGHWISNPVSEYPTVVLGATAARRLGITNTSTRLWSGGQWCSVIGILQPVTLAPELDSSALVNWSTARRYFGFDGRPSTLYVRADESQIISVSNVLPPSTNPQAPNEVNIDRPTDALVAREATNSALNGLLLALGGIALLIGGIGVANTMVISVMERRREIGLRRALGATRAMIRQQFLTESLLLAAIGGITGVALGMLVTAGVAVVQGWPIVVPAWASFTGVIVTMLTGAVAGLYPAIRASRVSPTEALQ